MFTIITLFTAYQVIIGIYTKIRSFWRFYVSNFVSILYLHKKTRKQLLTIIERPYCDYFADLNRLAIFLNSFISISGNSACDSQLYLQ